MVGTTTEKKCPNNMKFDDCACSVHCGETISVTECQDARRANGTCHSACMCEEGYVQYGDHCVVPEEHCPCQYEGVVYPVCPCKI